MIKWSRRKAISDLSIAFISQYLTQFILFFRNFIFAKLLGPADFGLYSAIFLFFSYGNYSNLGVIDGLSRIVPYELGAGRESKAREFLGSGFWGLNLITSAFLISVIVYSFISPFETIVENKTAVILTAIAVLLNQNFTYALLYYRVKHNFKKAYIFQLIQALLDLTFSILLLFKFRTVGIFLGMTFSFLLVCFLSLKGVLREINLIINWKLLRKILGVGFQILLIGFTYGFLMSIDKFSVANLFEKSKMGFYSVAVGFGVIPYFASVTVGQFIGQRMIEEFGRSKLKGNLKIFLDESLLVIAFITPLISMLTIALAEPFITIFLPKYVESLRYIDKLSIAYYFLSLGAILGTFLIAVNQQGKILVLNLIFIPFILLLNFVVFKNGFDLLGIAYVTFINFFLRTFILFVLSYINYSKIFLSVISFVKFSLPSLPILMVFALKFVRVDAYLRFYLRILIAFVWFGVSIYYLSRKTQIVSSMMSIVKEKAWVYLEKARDIF